MPSPTAESRVYAESLEACYTTTKDGREHRYWITVFATSKNVFVVEAAGDREPFDKSTSTVEGAIASLDAAESSETRPNGAVFSVTMRLLPTGRIARTHRRTEKTP